MNRSSAAIGAAFLMATSAIGPGFLTQTTVFTQQLLTSMGFVILCSVVIDIIAQLNIWQILAAHRLKGSELANQVIPGSGHVLTLLICFGGLAFNIGNSSGAGLGLNMLLPVSVEVGAGISAAIAILLFVVKDAASAMDRLVRLLGIVMLLLMLYVAFVAQPPVKEVLHHTVVPQSVNVTSIVTLVGGTVGGYITFAGIHRLLEAPQPPSLQTVKRSAVNGILLTAAMRILLFLAVLGVVWKGFVPAAANPAASVFQRASGQTGYFIFGIVLWSASITSIIGSAYTSISFIKTVHPFFDRNGRTATIIFILISTMIFVWIGKPVAILIAAGALNGFILPLSLALILWVAARQKTVNYKHPQWLYWTGWLVTAAMLWMSVVTFTKELPKLL